MSSPQVLVFYSITDNYLHLAWTPLPVDKSSKPDGEIVPHNFHTVPKLLFGRLGALSRKIPNVFYLGQGIPRHFDVGIYLVLNDNEFTGTPTINNNTTMRWFWPTLTPYWPSKQYYKIYFLLNIKCKQIILFLLFYITF